MSGYIQKMRCNSELPEKSITNSEVKYKTVGRFTSWVINCDCCDKKVTNSTEIDIYTKRWNNEFRINACHECSNTHVYPTLECLLITDGDVTPRDIGEFILSSYAR